MGQPAIQLSAAERKLLRRTFYRHAAPLLAGMALLCAFSLSRDGEPPAPEPTPVVEAVPPPPLSEDPAFLALEAELMRALGELRSRVENGAEQKGEASDKLASLEKKLGSTRRRLADLESQVAAVGQRATEVASAAPADVSTWDVSAILERLYALEKRQDQVDARTAHLGQDDPKTQQAVLNRLYQLESRVSQLSGAAAPSRP